MNRLISNIRQFLTEQHCDNTRHGPGEVAHGGGHMGVWRVRGFHVGDIILLEKQREQR